MDVENDQRRKNAQVLREAIADLPGLRAVPDGRVEGVEETYYNFTLDYDAEVLGVSREKFVEAVQAEGIPLKVNGYRALNLAPVFVNQDVWPYKLGENQLIIKRIL